MVARLIVKNLPGQDFCPSLKVSDMPYLRAVNREEAKVSWRTAAVIQVQPSTQTVIRLNKPCPARCTKSSTPEQHIPFCLSRCLLFFRALSMMIHFQPFKRSARHLIALRPVFRRSRRDRGRQHARLNKHNNVTHARPTYD